MKYKFLRYTLILILICAGTIVVLNYFEPKKQEAKPISVEFVTFLVEAVSQEEPKPIVVDTTDDSLNDYSLKPKYTHKKPYVSYA